MTNNYERVATRGINAIKEMLDKELPGGGNLKRAVQAYEEGACCPHCGCCYKAEVEMFSRDRLFVGHSCKGGIEND